MGPTREQYESEREFFHDYWELRKKFYNAKDEPDLFWERLKLATDAMCEKYHNRFAQDLLVAHIADVERRSKDGTDKSIAGKAERSIQDVQAGNGV